MNDKIKATTDDLESPFLDEEILEAEPQRALDPALARLAGESPFAKIMVEAPQTESNRQDIEETERALSDEELFASAGADVLDMEAAEIVAQEESEYSHGEDNAHEPVADLEQELFNGINTNDECSEPETETETGQEAETEWAQEQGAEESVSTAETPRTGAGHEEPETFTLDDESPDAMFEECAEPETGDEFRDPDVLQEEDASTRFEHVLPEPKRSKQEEVRDRPHILVVDDQDKPVADGEYRFHQGDLGERGAFSDERRGRAYIGNIDPAKPFVFEVCDRVCAIRAGAFFNPSDPKIEYGGTWFDWTLVRDNHRPATNFWPHYQREMDTVLALEARETTFDRRVDRFFQHEHITRRPIRIEKSLAANLSRVRIRAMPVRLRVGPFVRYTDDKSAVIWLETVTPAMVRVRYRKTGTTADTLCYTSTVRVGGRYFAAAELRKLERHTFYNYTVELAPLPASVAVPKTPGEFTAAFPKLSPDVAVSMKEQCGYAALGKTELLSFRTLQPKYDRFRFATGSCRWYPADKERGKECGPDMLEGLGGWLRLTPKDQWPEFLFLGGDQIYSDEIGDNHGEMIMRGRFASRLPGPTDPASALRDKLVDGAWAGRFAHRYHRNKGLDAKAHQVVESNLMKLDDIHKRYPDIQGIYLEYPDQDPEKKLRERHATLRNRRERRGAKGWDEDERKAAEAVNLLSTVKSLEVQAEPFRSHVAHWKADHSVPKPRNPMGRSFLAYNFLLWKIPDIEKQLPHVTDGRGNSSPYSFARKQDTRGHASAAGGMHAADFAEYAYLYERAWTSGRNVRALLAHMPTFLMFDDHEATDDWNADAIWVRMLYNAKDNFLMWPKTLTDALAAYWVYQGWCNKAPSQWLTDSRASALEDARLNGTDALPKLRRIIYDACFALKKEELGPNQPIQTGLNLQWHYKLPFDPPFLVPDCRSRKRMIPSDEKLREIDHDIPERAPKSQTIDDEQIRWMSGHLETWRGGPVAFIATSTPLLLWRKVATFMRTPQVAEGAWARGDVLSFLAALFGSKRLVYAGSTMLDRVFRLYSDLEHMIRDKTWRDLWKMADRLKSIGSPVKTLVLVSGDVHHNYAMTANLPGAGRPKPELLQITCSGLQTKVRSDLKKWIGEKLSGPLFSPFKIGKYSQMPGFMQKSGAGLPDLILYDNAVAIVDVSAGAEVDVKVTYVAGVNRHIFRYTSGAAYIRNGLPAVLQVPRRTSLLPLA